MDSLGLARNINSGRSEKFRVKVSVIDPILRQRREDEMKYGVLFFGPMSNEHVWDFNGWWYIRMLELRSRTMSCRKLMRK
jgi:hypothetical protein